MCPELSPANLVRTSLPLVHPVPPGFHARQ